MKLISRGVGVLGKIPSMGEGVLIFCGIRYTTEVIFSLLSVWALQKINISMYFLGHEFKSKV